MKRHVCAGCCHAFRTAKGLKRHQSRTANGPHAEPKRRMTTPREWRAQRAEGRQDRAGEHMANPARPQPVRTARTSPRPPQVRPVQARELRPPLPVRAPRVRLPRSGR